MKLIIVLLAVLILAFSTTAQTNSANNNSDNTVQVTLITQMSSTKAIPIAARAGDQFTVTLSSNQTTGYKWRLANKLDPKLLKQVSSKYNEPKGGLIGQGGTETWTFKAIGKGKPTIAMEYARPWEKNTPPVKTQAFAITIQ